MEQRDSRNMAMFSSGLARQSAEVTRALAHLGAAPALHVVSDGWRLPEAPRKRGPAPALLSFAEAGFLETPISFKTVQARISDWIGRCHPRDPPGDAVLVIDMSWALATNSATANCETWMEIAEALARDWKRPVVSLYNRKLMIDEQLMTALRGHPLILTTERIHDNPHWLPPRLLTRGTLRQQVDHWLSAISPDLAPPSEGPEIHAAEGADPMWLLRRTADERAMVGPEARERWKIRCFGRLRVYRNDGSQIIWDTPGGATRKTKTLFAYLLQKGGDGASTEELADLLWPDAASSEAARNRLYHTVRYLREALGDGDRRGDRGVDRGPERDGPRDGERYLIRDSSRYVLIPPDKSWLDISRR